MRGSDGGTRRMVYGVVLVLLCTGLLGFGGPAYGAVKTTITFWTFLNPEAADPRSKALKATIDSCNSPSMSTPRRWRP